MTNEYLRYILLSAGGATVENFVEDFEPIGAIIWGELVEKGLVYVDKGRIKLSDKGHRVYNMGEN